MSPVERRSENRHRLSGSAAGLLVIEGSREPLACDAVDVSRGGMGITTREALTVGQALCLSVGAKRIRLVVVWSKPVPAPAGWSRCGLATVEAADNPEALFFKIQNGDARHDGESECTLNGMTVRAARISLDGELQVAARTFGDRVTYALEVVNASRSGMLVRPSADQAAPFNVGSLLEIEIDPMARWSKSAIHCMAKVVRTQDGVDAAGRPVRAYGLQVTEMTLASVQAWDACLLALSEA